MAPRKTTTAIANYDEAFAQYAQQTAEQEKHTGGGQFFSMRGGILSLGGDQFPNNEMVVIVTDFISENVYYEGRFDPDNPTGPACYAFGRAEEEMEPHADAPSKQADNCAGCEHNQWGSGIGKGKACRNRRRLACLAAGVLTPNGEFTPFEADVLKTKPVAYLAIPPTSLASWANHVKSVAEVCKRPPFGVYTKIAVAKDPKVQFRVNFETFAVVPNELAQVAIDRHEEVKSQIAFPYMAAVEAPQATRKASKARRKRFQ